MNQIITFKKEETKELAIFIAQLVREGISFEIINGQPTYQVKILNGF